VRGVVVGDEHQGAPPCSRRRHAADRVGAGPGRHEVPQPLGAPAEVELERHERARGQRGAARAAQPRRGDAGQQVRHVALRDRALVAEPLDPHVLRAGLAQAASPPLRRSQLAGRSGAAVHGGERLDIGAQVARGGV
jgi:hypothetical protein